MAAATIGMATSHALSWKNAATKARTETAIQIVSVQRILTLSLLHGPVRPNEILESQRDLPW